MQVKRAAPRVLIVGSLIALLVAVSSCAPGGTAHHSPPAPTVALYPTPLPTLPVGIRPSPVAGLLGPAPTNCPSVPPPQTFTLPSDFGGGFIGALEFEGSSPAWAFGILGVVSLGQDGTPVPYPSTKVMWIVGPNFLQPVTLQGHELRTNVPLWFQIYPNNGVPPSNPDADSVYTTNAVLDPGAPNRGSTDNTTGHWNIWGIGVIVLVAGCYEMDVSSAAGIWHMVFAAGR
jgi:hypothetical protein